MNATDGVIRAVQAHAPRTPILQSPPPAVPVRPLGHPALPIVQAAIPDMRALQAPPDQALSDCAADAIGGFGSIRWSHTEFGISSG